MKNLLITGGLCFWLLIMNLSLNAQGTDKIRTLKTNYVVQQLTLTAKDQDKFLVLYNAYLDELDAVRKKHPSGSATDKIERQEGELQLNKTYISKFKSILSEEKVNKIFEAENEFNRKLIEELDKRKSNE